MIESTFTADGKAGQAETSVGEKISGMVRLLSLDARRKSAVVEQLKR